MVIYTSLNCVVKIAVTRACGYTFLELDFHPVRVQVIVLSSFFGCWCINGLCIRFSEKNAVTPCICENIAVSKKKDVYYSYCALINITCQSL